MKAEIFHNRNKDGIEIVFSDKPEDFINLQLSNLGFKYTKMTKKYFADYSNVLWNTVHDILDEYLTENKRKAKKEISIPEIDMDIFDKTHIKKAPTTRMAPSLIAEGFV
jgi:hypothetical protein